MWEKVEQKTGKVGEFVYLCTVKTALHHTATLLLTLCILLSSVGVALSSQLCSMTGENQVSSQVTDKCCQHPEIPADNEDDCCEDAISYEKLDPISTVKFTQFDLPVYFPASFKLNNVFKPAVIRADTHIYTYTDSSPPLYGRCLLSKIQTLLI